MKDKKKSLMYRLFVKMKHFSGVFTHSDSLSLVLLTYWLIDACEYAQVGLSYTELFCLKQIFLKMATLKILSINVSKDLQITYT